PRLTGAARAQAPTRPPAPQPGRPASSASRGVKFTASGGKTVLGSTAPTPQRSGSPPPAASVMEAMVPHKAGDRPPELSRARLAPGQVTFMRLRLALRAADLAVAHP